MDYASGFVSDYAKELAAHIKSLIESKHLYQSVRVPPSEELLQRIASYHRYATHQEVECPPEVYDHFRWGFDKSAAPVAIPIKSVYISCESCGPQFHKYDTSFDPLYVRYIDDNTTPILQTFILVFECSGCEASTSFLLRRVGIDVEICGRSPIESLPLSKKVPKVAARHFKNAWYAHYCGQALASLCLLRIGLEQHMRTATKAGPSDKADQVYEKYAGTVPHELRDRIPSLKSIYIALSGAIHQANADSGLFLSSWDDATKHFDLLFAWRAIDKKAP